MRRAVLLLGFSLAQSFPPTLRRRATTEAVPARFVLDGC